LVSTQLVSHDLKPSDAYGIRQLIACANQCARTIAELPCVTVPCRTRAGWEIQNSTKTDRNLFFASKNLLQLEAQLDAGDAGAGSLSGKSSRATNI
jgi:hypothetical protein